MDRLGSQHCIGKGTSRVAVPIGLEGRAQTAEDALGIGCSGAPEGERLYWQIHPRNDS